MIEQTELFAAGTHREEMEFRDHVITRRDESKLAPGRLLREKTVGVLCPRCSALYETPLVRNGEVMVCDKCGLHMARNNDVLTIWEGVKE